MLCMSEIWPELPYGLRILLEATCPELARAITAKEVRPDQPTEHHADVLDVRAAGATPELLVPCDHSWYVFRLLPAGSQHGPRHRVPICVLLWGGVLDNGSLYLVQQLDATFAC